MHCSTTSEALFEAENLGEATLLANLVSTPTSGPLWLPTTSSVVGRFFYARFPLCFHYSKLQFSKFGFRLKKSKVERPRTLAACEVPADSGRLSIPP